MPSDLDDPSGLIGFPRLPSLAGLWHGLTDQISCGFEWLGSALDSAWDWTWEHRVGVLQGLSIAAGIAVIAAPAVLPLLLAGTSLDVAAISTSLTVGSTAFAVLAAVLDERHGKGTRSLAQVVLLMLGGGAVAGGFAAGGMPALAGIANLVLLGVSNLPALSPTAGL